MRGWCKHTASMLPGHLACTASVFLCVFAAGWTDSATVPCLQSAYQSPRWHALYRAMMFFFCCVVAGWADGAAVPCVGGASIHCSSTGGHRYDALCGSHGCLGQQTCTQAISPPPPALIQQARLPTLIDQVHLCHPHLPHTL